jgi:hypothetical protein
VRHEDGGDVPIIGEQIALGQPALGEEDLVQVGEPQDPLAATDLGLDRPLAMHLLRGLVLAEALVGRRP